MSTLTFKAVILAGGSGERFWPLSTPERPKQFLRVFGGASLIRQAVSRLDGLVSPKDVFVVTAKNLVAATRRELPEIPKCNILGEPMRRDTGAAVALGVGLAASDADPVIGFFSSDQMVSNPKAFRKVVSKAVAIARRKQVIVTLGIKPTYPATCFGYISPKTRTFVEKPDAKKAKKYVKAGYLWNAGMFIARASTFRGAFAAHAPELERLTRLETDGTNRTDGTRSRSTAIAGGSLAKLYSALPKISFDYAVMEKSKNVEVVPGDFGWDDVGSFAAFDKYFPHDSRGNVREGPCTVVEADGNICVARSARISLLGVKNLVVVTTPDSVLVADKSRLTDMKKLFKR
ncbi:MAG: mannose-1-phosphate guanylyltransferase [Kiritimatiellae bacterium]|nr:mannose-1-phosphate guanylyltransferase [Kiritimatiellia bacterium]